MQLSNLYAPWSVDNAHWGIEIVEGKFKDSVIQIENVEFDEQDTSSLKVDYHTINMPETLVKEDYNTQEFYDIMQLVLSDIISKAVEEHRQSNDN